MKILITLISVTLCTLTSLAQQSSQTLPLSTQLTLSSATVFNQKDEVLNVLFIINGGNNSSGTGFKLKSGYIITCEHVVRGATLSQLKLISPDGNPYAVKSVIVDSVRDLAVIATYNKSKGGLELGSDSTALIGHQVYTWGYPIGYNGPSPLLSVGYVAGIVAQRPTSNSLVKHLVVNGAFNPGNSGGPLIDSGKVIGVVQSKAAPMTPYIYSALQALKGNPSGMMYESKDILGNTRSLSEAQIIEQILSYYRELSQVMIGEAVSVSELKRFLKEHNIRE